MQQQEEDESEGDHEQRVRRVGDAERGREMRERVAPDRQAEDDEPAAEPDERIALQQAAPPDQLEDHEQQQHRADDRDDLDPVLHQLAATGASSPGSMTRCWRNRPMKIASSTLIM